MILIDELKILDDKIKANQAVLYYHLKYWINVSI